MTYNDGYKLKEWANHYSIYKELLDVFVIVDNGSEDAYLKELRETFPEAVLIERKSNGGCTAAYNDGIKYVLNNTDIEAIVIIANDMKLSKGCLMAMYEYLFSKEDLGIVSSAILYKDSDIIDNYGHCVHGITVSYCNRGEHITDIKVKQKYTDLVSGGFTMAKRQFYVRAGLQDEALFMYCDELDTMLKAKKSGFKIGVIGNEYAWHWHINQPATSKRSSASRYLISRNRVYVTRKNNMRLGLIKSIFIGMVKSPIAFLLRFFKEKDKEYLNDAKYSFIGVIHGLTGRMYTNQYTRF